MLAEGGGLRLHPDTVAALNAARLREGRRWRRLGWAALLLAAAGLFVAVL
jgi:ubiquinone biosynthesis protein